MKMIRPLLGLLAMSCSLTAAADKSDVKISVVDNQRAEFLKVEEQLKTARYEEIDQLIKPLRDYVLFPYLRYQSYLRFTSKLSQAEVNAFLDAYPLFPRREALQRAWLTRLAKSKRWAEWTTAYQRLPILTPEFQCYKARALLGTGNSEQAMAAAEQLWLVGESQADACDPLFERWMKAGHPSKETASKRYWLAVEAGEMRLARYLHRFMSKADIKHAMAYERLRQRSRNVPDANLSAFPKSTQDALVTRAFKRLARGDAEKTARRWLDYRKSWQADDAKKLELDLYIGKRLAYVQTDKAKALIAKLDPEHALGELTEARLRQLLASQDLSWIEVRQLIEELPETLRSSDRWRYWEASALDKLQRQSVEGSPASAPIWQALSKSRSFYGFLAADRLGVSVNLNAETRIADPEIVAGMQASPALQRAKEWLLLDRRLEATREWVSAKSAFEENERAQLAALATDWGWSHRAIMEAIHQQQWNFLDARFPSLFADIFKAEATKKDIDAIWATAIARQESAFKPEAVSPAGARGLMQLMPSTARQTARKHSVPYKKTAQLFKPETNIALGTAYLAEMYLRFDGNRAYASAAYNAGPHRVEQWLDERGHLPLDIWMETIPYQETRNYVQNVLAFRVVYAQRAGMTVSMLSPSERRLLAYQQSSESLEVTDSQTTAETE